MKDFFCPQIFLYIGAVVVVNLLFSVVPLISTPVGLLSPVAILVGFVFVIRDFAQRAAGHGVLIAMVAGTVLSYIMADPFVAIASALAFASSEVVDYLTYTLTKLEFRKRVLISSLFSTPVDTFVFLYMIDAFTPGTVALMIFAKMIAVAVVWNWHSERSYQRV